MSGISIGVDVGSTSIKAVALDRDTQQVLAVESVLLDSQVEGLPSGHHEEDPRRIRELTWELVRRLGRQYGDRIDAISFTGQMHSGMIVGPGLEPLTNLVTWQDKRGDEVDRDGRSFVDRLRDIGGADTTGVGIHSGFLAVTALWWRSHGTRVPADGYIIGIYDWLTSLLAGRSVTDITSAAAWGLFDITRKEWRSELVSALVLRAGKLPEVNEPGQFVGTIQPTVAKGLNLPTATRIYASVGDTQASFIGAGTRPDEILLNFGTGSQSMWESPLRPAVEGTDIRYLRDGRYIVTAPTLAGGKAYRILAGFYRSVLGAFGHPTPSVETLYEVMNAAAENAEMSDLTFDPIFGGSRWREPSARATLSGLTSDNFEFGAVTRALLAGMVEEIAAPYFEMEAHLRHKGLRGSGNGMRRNPALRKIAEERFGLPLVLAESEEEAARGAALLTLS